MLEQGFFHDGTRSSFRGRRHGRRLDTRVIPASRLVVCSDNHDQIGNRADGSRLSTRLTVPQLQIAAALTLLNANTPMVFMGQEWAASTPWAFFSSHPEPDLAAAVTEGRLQEFAEMAWDRAQVPDPQSPRTFQRSKLRWDELGAPGHAEMLRTYRDLIALRRAYPDLVDPRFDYTSTRHDAGGRWLVLERGREMALVVNLGVRQVEVAMEGTLEPIYVIGTATCLPGERGATPAVRLAGHSAAVVRVR